jgi:predicted ester cyclase
MSDMSNSKRLVLQYLEALSGKAKPADVVARFVSDTALAEHIRKVEAAFPAYELHAAQVIAEGDLVAMRGTFRGVHRGTFAGIDATGIRASADLMIVYRVEGDKIAAHWMQFDAAGLMAQLQTAVAAR